VRGAAKGGAVGVAGGGNGSVKKGQLSGVVPLPPSATELEKSMAGAIPSVSSSSLKESSSGELQLIGTVGDRALLLKPNGDTAVVSVGSEFDIDGKKAKLVAINLHSADVLVGGMKKTLTLQASSALIDKATQAQQQDDAAQKSGATSTGSKK
jgi:hypothetical protein